MKKDNEQEKHIDDQDAFLIRNHIKTREQIDFERKIDRIQNRIGTEFSCKLK